MRSESTVFVSPRSRERRPTVVEFVGTPGSGKTTLSREVVEQLRGQGLRASTIIGSARPRARDTFPGRMVARVTRGRIADSLLWLTFYGYASADAVAFAMERPELARLVATSQRRRPLSSAMKRHILYWWAQLAGRYRFLTADSTACDVLVIDDGFLHRSVALNASHLEDPDPAAIAGYVDLLPRPDLVIRAVADRQVCERRVQDRGIWRHSRSLGREEIARSLGSAERAVDLAVLRARERGWRVVEIDNDRDLALVEQELRDVVVPMIAPPQADRRPEEVMER